MTKVFASAADRARVEGEMPWAARPRAQTLYDCLTHAKDTFGARPAISFQMFSDPDAHARTLDWAALHRRVTQAANLFRALGVGPGDSVAFVLPNALETVVTLFGGAVAGVVTPINPLLEPDHIASVLRETGAKVVVTLRAFPKTDLAQKVAQAVAAAPAVTHVIEVDLLASVTGVKRWIIPVLRPRLRVTHQAKVLDFDRALNQMPADRLTFDDPGDRIAACFMTGGTTGRPKLARHRYEGMIYNGWLGATLLFEETDVMICPLPLFHVFAAYPILMSAVQSGAHVVLPTPAGYRGAGVMDNFWSLIERWNVTFMIAVPTAISALLSRPVNADISSLRIAISGSAPLSNELYNRFRAATGIGIAEGYGLTEATCLVAVNPIDGVQKVGSVGIPMPYNDVAILRPDDVGHSLCDIGDIGEICLSGPGVTPGEGQGFVYHHDRLFLRTGDLGRLDADGYLWITGRAKDLILRGGHNIDPAAIEEVLMAHPDVAAVAAIGQPDAFAGELPCAYVELLPDRTVSVEAILQFAQERIQERAAVPKYIEILPDLPKTAVGKIFKPALRRLAIARVFDAVLSRDCAGAVVTDVVEDPARGLVACLDPGIRSEDDIRHALKDFTIPWDVVKTSRSA